MFIQTKGGSDVGQSSTLARNPALHRCVSILVCWRPVNAIKTSCSPAGKITVSRLRGHRPNSSAPVSNKKVNSLHAVIAVLLLRAACLACGCGAIEHACQGYKSAALVFTGTLMNLEPRGASLVPNRPGSYSQRIEFKVDESFKGPSQGTTFIVTFEHHASSCGTSAPEFVIGNRYLVWAFSYGEGEPLIDDCTPTRNLADAAQLISELRELRSGGGPTYVFGNAYRDHDVPVVLTPQDLEPAPLAETKIIVASHDHSYGAISDDKGYYIVPVEADGIYSVRADIPNAVQTGGIAGEFGVVAHECINASLSVRQMFPIRGRILDDHGVPLRGVSVDLLSAHTLQGLVHTITDIEGRYEFSPSDPGQYIVAVNWDNAPAADSPFATTFYPGVRNLQSATVFETNQAPIELADLHLSRASQCSALFLLEDRDGKPVQGASVMLKYFPEQYWHPVETAGSDGRVSVKVYGPGPIVVVASRQPGMDDDIRSEEKTIRLCPSATIQLRMTKTVHAE